ncbi:MAG: VrrA/YqfQ family protein [Bacillota bacterium]
MFPGPGAPFHGRGMRMMGPGPTRQGHSPFGGSFMGPRGPSHPRMNPMMGARQPAKQGGILARILGKGQGATGFPGFGASAQGATRAAGGGGGLLNALTNPSSINGFLNNTQQVLKTAQQVGPMIQQYGPLVKNLPAMWKLYRGLKDLPDQEEEVETTSNESKPSTETSRKSISTEKTKRKNTASTSSSPKESRPKPVTRDSRPKLFI